MACGEFLQDYGIIGFVLHGKSVITRPGGKIPGLKDDITECIVYVGKLPGVVGQEGGPLKVDGGRIELVKELPRAENGKLYKRLMPTR